jgi:hypothetical protein
MRAPKPGWLMRFYHAAQLGLRAAQSACEHTDHDQGSRRGCGGCRAVVALREVLAEFGTVHLNISEEDWQSYQQDMADMANEKASDAAKQSAGPQE